MPEMNGNLNDGEIDLIETGLKKSPMIAWKIGVKAFSLIKSIGSHLLGKEKMNETSKTTEKTQNVSKKKLNQKERSREQKQEKNKAVRIEAPCTKTTSMEAKKTIISLKKNRAPLPPTKQVGETVAPQSTKFSAEPKASFKDKKTFAITGAKKHNAFRDALAKTQPERGISKPSVGLSR